MTGQTGLRLANEEQPGTSLRSLGTRLSSLKVHLAAWVTTCADHYKAAALYEQLSGLSDAELHRRGLSRLTLGRDVREACDSTARR
jgi:hypothetical protein